MKKDNLTIRLKFHIIIFLLFIHAAWAQNIPSQVLNSAKTFEVTACKPSENGIICAWMEMRPESKDSAYGTELQVSYKASTNNGKSWTEKRIIDLPNTLVTANPYLTCNEKGETYLVCMHVNKNIYSGNISFYQYDSGNQQFTLKSVPVKSDSTLLDKPAMVAFGNEIHIVYVSYDPFVPGSERFINTLNYQISRDKGQSWSEPARIFLDSNLSHMGPSIALVKDNQVVISCGSYEKNIYTIKTVNTGDSLSFDQPVIVSKLSTKLSNAMTELVGNGNHSLVMTWQTAHSPGEVWLSRSDNEGKNWNEPVLVTKNGNLMSTAFDRQSNVHCLYSDFSKEQFCVVYQVLNKQQKMIKKAMIRKPTPLPQLIVYMGAFQKLIVQKNKVLAFWIDYPNGNTLKFSNWKNQINQRSRLK